MREHDQAVERAPKAGQPDLVTGGVGERSDDRYQRPLQGPAEPPFQFEHLPAGVVIRFRGQHDVLLTVGEFRELVERGSAALHARREVFGSEDEVETLVWLMDRIAP